MATSAPNGNMAAAWARSMLQWGMACLERSFSLGDQYGEYVRIKRLLEQILLHQHI